MAARYRERHDRVIRGKLDIGQADRDGGPTLSVHPARPVWMDSLETRKVIKRGSRSDLLGNKLVLIAPATDRAMRLRIDPGFPLLNALGDGRLAMADPAEVPAGMYG